ncbi:PRC-barrel domain-containing protein [Litorisediminicola beolgyonensis]|uniref:PRC-barrel domain-containing protein n=1 Tax=Litorisediminicola beolgyonensis TaxID=1173614 RepID=A0ABW3ZGK0_9RHOB
MQRLLATTALALTLTAMPAFAEQHTNMEQAGNDLENAAENTAEATENAAEDAAQATENAAEETGEAVENAAEETENAAENAAEATENAAEDAAEATENAANEVEAEAKEATEEAMAADQADAKLIRTRDIVGGVVYSIVSDDAAEAQEEQAEEAGEAAEEQAEETAEAQDASMAEEEQMEDKAEAEAEAAASGNGNGQDMAASGQVTLSAEGYDSINPEWENIGNIEDVVLSQDGQLQGVVAEIGGFLGIGDKKVFVKVDEMKLAPTDNNTYALVVPFSKEQLESMNSVDEGFWE